MTTTQPQRLETASGPARRVLTLLVGFVLALLGLAVDAGQAAAQTHVGPHHQNLILTVRTKDCVDRFGGAGAALDDLSFSLKARLAMLEQAGADHAWVEELRAFRNEIVNAFFVESGRPALDTAQVSAGPRPIADHLAAALELAQTAIAGRTR